MDEGSVEASVGKNGDVNIGGELSGESKADNEIPSSSIRFDEENLLKSEIDAQDRKDQENERPLEMGSIDFKDHHSLKSSSSTLLFRQRLVQVYNQRNSQFILEAKENDETGQTEVTAKIGKDSSFGLMAMRVTYTLVAAVSEKSFRSPLFSILPMDFSRLLWSFAFTFITFSSCWDSF